MVMHFFRVSAGEDQCLDYFEYGDMFDYVSKFFEGRDYFLGQYGAFTNSIYQYATGSTPEMELENAY
jgi:hypothetical protein